MTKIRRYVAPMTECINGLPRQDHYFYLEADYEEALEIGLWIRHVCEPYSYTYWHETIPGRGPQGWSKGEVLFRVSLQADRAAKLFKLRW